MADGDPKPVRVTRKVEHEVGCGILVLALVLTAQIGPCAGMITPVLQSGFVTSARVQALERRVEELEKKVLNR